MFAVKLHPACPQLLCNRKVLPLVLVGLLSWSALLVAALGHGMAIESHGRHPDTHGLVV